MKIEIKKHYYNNGNIMSELSYLNGGIYGVNRQYYKNGNIEGEYYYNRFGMHGLEQWWHNGNYRSAIFKNRNGRRHGLSLKINYN